MRWERTGYTLLHTTYGQKLSKDNISQETELTATTGTFGSEVLRPLYGGWLLQNCGTGKVGALLSWKQWGKGWQAGGGGGPRSSAAETNAGVLLSSHIERSQRLWEPWKPGQHQAEHASSASCSWTKKCEFWLLSFPIPPWRNIPWDVYTESE